jgi:hypothetical protein
MEVIIQLYTSAALTPENNPGYAPEPVWMFLKREKHK